MPNQTTIQLVPIGGNRFTVELPGHLHVEEELPDTVLAYTPENDFANLRFTVFTITSRDPGDSNLGYRHVLETSQEKSLQATVMGDRVWHYGYQDSEQDGEKTNIHCWSVGLGNDVLILTCCVVDSMRHHPVSQEMIDGVIPAIKSFRHAPAPRHTSWWQKVTGWFIPRSS